MASSKRHLRLIAGIVLAVLLGHWAVLAWLQTVWQATPLLRPLATPMYTRLLTQTAPPDAAVAQPPPAPPPRVRRALTAAAPRADSAAHSADTSLATPASPAPEPSTNAGTTTSTSPDAERTTTPASSTTPTATAATVPASATPTTVTPQATAPSPAASSPTDLWPADTRLSYRLSGYYRGDLHGDARVQWQRTGEQYQVRIEVDVGILASLSMTSQGTVTPQGLVPRAYEELVRSKRRWATLGEDQVTLENGKQVARPAGVQDTASQFVELAHQFSSGRAVLQAGRQVQFWMARPAAVDLWTYDMLEEVTLQTPHLGPIRAIHLKPRPIANPRGNITAEMWFAPSLQYLPVRIRIQVGESSYVDLLVDRIEQR